MRDPDVGLATDGKGIESAGEDQMADGSNSGPWLLRSAFVFDLPFKTHG